MPDITQLSDQELMQMSGQSNSNDITKLTDAQLKNLANGQNPPQFNTMEEAQAGQAKAQQEQQYAQNNIFINPAKTIGNDIKGIGSGMANAAMHPLQTAGGMIGAGVGAIEKFSPMSLMMKALAGHGQNIELPQEKYINAVGEDLKNKYGSLGAVSETLSHKPVSAALDATMALGGIEGLAKEAGGVAGLAKLGKEGVVATKKAITPTFHNEEFIRGQAKNVQQVASGLDNALHSLYQDFYKNQGLSDVPLDSSKADEILLSNKIPDSIIKTIDDQIGRINTVGKAHEARQLINKNLTQSTWNKDLPGGDFNPREAAKSTAIQLKDLMRATTKSVNPEATALLEKLDKDAYENIYPRIDRFKSMVGYGPMAEQYPNTAPILSLMKGGLAKTSTLDMIKDTPEKIAGLGKYLDSPEFKQDLDKTLTASKNFAKGIKDFQDREKLKKFGKTAIKDTVLGGLLTKMFKF